MNNNKSQIFNAERAIEIEKEFKEHPERNRVKTVKIAAEEIKKKVKMEEKKIENRTERNQHQRGC